MFLLSGYLYWTNTNETKIQRAFILDERPNEVIIEDVVTSELVSPSGIVGDWQNRQLYWSDSGICRPLTVHMKYCIEHIMLAIILVDLQSNNNVCGIHVR